MNKTLCYNISMNRQSGREGLRRGKEHERYLADCVVSFSGWGCYGDPELDYEKKVDFLVICPLGKEFPVQASVGGKSKRATTQLAERGISVVTKEDAPNIHSIICNQCAINEVCVRSRKTTP